MATLKLLKNLSIATAGATIFLLESVGTAQAATLWYNGDFDDVTGLANVINTGVSDSYVYDDFTIADGEIWNIDTIWSNNLMTLTGVTQSAWFIRTGVSQGNGGTVVASGISAATQTATGRKKNWLDEYRIEISGLNINLGAGTYWLSVAPIGFGSDSGWSFISTTSGANAVGNPAGNNQNSFWNSSFFGNNYQVHDKDFSMGIAGISKSVPEPNFALALLALGILSAGSMLKRK
ncbi:hypothetical protein [Floridanema evergladense]|uniref:PEP-CTERM protein-sorting domain-containing protein n=1 Tax=Floridaenema evergladense BLCC-F167 TaxID=3153639 RepID=A0ABV4WYU4_9CYAN